ncbi:hypothetical protein [Castellaniella sp.]|uniref:hypothetical protein n=1 Tax=Castellaniella sp. TaxID=1955812 RepID=UPI003C72CF87
MNSLLLLQALLAAGAGLLLNLTPCVLPAVPLKVRAVLREAGERQAVRLASAALFTAGSVLFFGGLGLASPCISSRSMQANASSYGFRPAMTKGSALRRRRSP